jgi:hypothetical protein
VSWNTATGRISGLGELASVAPVHLVCMRHLVTPYEIVRPAGFDRGDGSYVDQMAPFQVATACGRTEYHCTSSTGFDRPNQSSWFNSGT